MAALTAEERAESQEVFEQYEPRQGMPQPPGIWGRTTPLEVVREAFDRIKATLSSDAVRNEFNDYLELQEEGIRFYYDEPIAQNYPLADRDMIIVAEGTQEDQNKLDREIYKILVGPKLRKQARDLASGEVAGILRHRDQTNGLAPPGSALDRAMASGILPGQVGQFLTNDPNIIKGSEGSVKKSLRNIGDKVKGGRRTRKSKRRARKTRRRV